jgi:hypothetical protein
MQFDLISEVLEKAMNDLRYSESEQAWVKRKLVEDDDIIQLVEISADKVRPPKIMNSIEEISDVEYLMSYELNWKEF